MICSEENKKKLRKIKLVSPVTDVVRNTLVAGCLNQGAYIQFGRDVSLYGLWESLLYAESYENDGMYKKGTVEKALAAAIEQMAESVSIA